MELTYYLCDVFTTHQFGGNPLAVVLGKPGLSTATMQKIAREFNFSETTFVFEPNSGGDKHVRIFTPSREVPFAGHPNVGTAFVLRATGLFDNHQNTSVVHFEEAAGMVPVSIRHNEQGVFCELTAPEEFSTGIEVPESLVAEALSLPIESIKTSNHPPIVASVGLAFVIVELHNLDDLERIKLNPIGFDKIAELGIEPDIHVYVKSDSTLQTRMFAPHDGVPEDPATGSANCALSALLADITQNKSSFEFTIEQGVKMGRPSQLFAQVKKQQGKIEEVKIGGYSRMFSQGVLTLTD